MVSRLLLVSLLVAVAYGQIFHASFIHGVLDGPNADIWLNGQLAWPNVMPGTVTPYAASDMSTSTTYINGVLTPSVTLSIFTAGTNSSYFGSAMTGTFFESTHLSGYSAIYGSYNGQYDSPAVPMWVGGSYNLNPITQDSPLCAFRTIFDGPTYGTHVHVTAQKLVYGSYRTYLDSKVEQLGASIYSVLSPGVYLVNITAPGDSEILFSQNFTLSAGNAYSMVVMGNTTVTQYTMPIFVQLTQDYTPVTTPSGPAPAHPTIPPFPPPPPTPAGPESASTSSSSHSSMNFVLVVCFIAAVCIAIWAAVRTFRRQPIAYQKAPTTINSEC